MCQAQYGGTGLSAPAPPPSGTAPAPVASSAVEAGATGAPVPVPPTNGSEAGSKTHTIIVAPTQGVLRFGTSPSSRHTELIKVPFAVKAEQGDTLEYIWGGGPVSLCPFQVIERDRTDG